jgi:polyhydroxybutyrate depolymerase
MMRILTLLSLAALLLAGCLPTETDGGGPGARRQRMPQRGVVQSDLEEATITVSGRQRSYYVHRPATRSESKLPLVLAFHGGEGHPSRLAAQTGFDSVADRNGFMVVYPSASPNQWNDGRTTTAQFGDDVTFIRRLIEHLVATERVDAARIYATGPSNGGTFTLRLACELNDRIAAFGVVNASFPDPYWKSCAPRRAVPILIIHGSEDQFVKWEGGEIKHGRTRGVGGVAVAVPTTVDFWRKNDGCRTPAETERLPDVAPNDGTRVEVDRYPGCREGSDVVLVRIMGGGHTWPGRRAGQANRLAGRVCQDIDGSQYIWDFFKDYRLPAA